ncbi:thioredoxin-disulfide reductase [Candidatus Saganbacteria bacterium]|nr:thioredoxin-disulfide reductase [Candidatus Saganbacteria bacterium]
MPKLEAIVQNAGPHFDLIIIGGGPAGLTAAIYAGRSRLKMLVIEKALVGGMATTTFHIDNYPGFPEGISGIEISQRLEQQVQKLDVPIFYGDVTNVHKDRSIEIDGKKLTAKALIIATGSETLKLNVPGEKELRGRGVSYCATCDGAFYREKNIAVVGGGNSAVEEAIYLTRFGKTVNIIHRRDRLRADKILAEQATINPKIFIHWNSVVQKIEGEKKVEKILLENVNTKIKSKIPVDGVFIYVGMKPNTDIVKKIVKLSENGSIVADHDMKTSAPGIFACGDVIDKSLRQIVTACGDGAIAAESARKFIEEGK